MDSFEDDGSYSARHNTFVRRSNLYVFGTHDDVYGLVLFKTAVQASKGLAAETHQSVVGHNPREDVAFPDKVGNEGVFGFVINHFGGADLLNGTVRHNDDCVRHSKRFFLIVRDVDKGDAKPFVHGFELELHFLAHFKVECTEGFVEQEDLGFVDDGARDGDTLLLTARKGGDTALFKSRKVYDFERFAHLFLDDFLRKLCKFFLFVAFAIEIGSLHAFEL